MLLDFTESLCRCHRFWHLANLALAEKVRAMLFVVARHEGAVERAHQELLPPRLVTVHAVRFLGGAEEILTHARLTSLKATVAILALDVLASAPVVWLAADITNRGHR